MKNKWLHFVIDKETVFGLGCGVMMLLLSVAMTLFHSEISNILLRDVFMILLLGFLLPLYYILIAGASLLGMFISKNTEDIIFQADSFYAVTYILAAGIYEAVLCWDHVCYGILFHAEYFCDISLFLGCRRGLGCFGEFRSGWADKKQNLFYHSSIHVPCYDGH